MGKYSDDYMPWRDQTVLDIIGDNMWNERKGSCFCENVDFQTYAHVVGMKKPFKEGWAKDIVPIDVCIATEIAELWHKGVITLNSCCGHGKTRSNVIVLDTEVVKMQQLGYNDMQEIPSGLPCFFLKTGTIRPKQPNNKKRT